MLRNRNKQKSPGKGTRQSNSGSIGSIGPTGSKREKIDTVGSELLEVCKRSPNDLERIQNLVWSCPETAIEYKDGDKRTALHILCGSKAQFYVIQFIVQLNPDACSQTTAKGMLPLHYACREQSSMAVIQVLLSNFPESIRRPTSSGWLPLHLACARRAPPEVVQMLIDEWPDSVHQATANGRLALHFACANQTSLAVIKLLVRRFRHAIPVKDRNEWTPLHIACAYSPSLEVVQHLVDEWKDGLQCRGKQGRIPLQVACWEGQPLHVIQYLVEQYHKSLHIRDSEGLLPLHAACQGGADLSVVQYLIVQAPITAYEIGRTPQEMGTYACNFGNLPQDASQLKHDIIEWMRRNVPSLEHIQECNQNQENATSSNSRVSAISPLTKLFVPPQGSHLMLPVMERPPSLAPTISGGSAGQSSTEFRFEPPPRGPSAQSRSPSTNSQARRTSAEMEQDTWSAGQRLHRACEVPQSLRIIRDLLEEFPTAIDYRIYGQLCPIHTACMNQAPPEVVACLCRYHPHAIQQVDSDGNLPIHLACFSSAPLESIQFLIQKWPESLDLRNKEDETPVYRSKHPFLDNPDIQVIRYLENQLNTLHTELRQRERQLSRNNPLPQSNSTVSSTATTTRALPSPQARLYPAHGASPSSSTTERRSITVPEPMGATELREKLNALRSAKKDSRQGLDTVSLASAVGQEKLSRNPYSVPMSPASHQEAVSITTANRGSPSLSLLVTTRYRDRTSRSPSPTASRAGQTSQSNSPARIRFPSPAQIFGRLSRNSSPAQNRSSVSGEGSNCRNRSPLKFPFMGGISSRNSSPARGGTSATRSLDSSVFTRRSCPSNEFHDAGRLGAWERIPNKPPRPDALDHCGYISESGRPVPRPGSGPGNATGRPHPRAVVAKDPIEAMCENVSRSYAVPSHTDVAATSTSHNTRGAPLRQNGNRTFQAPIVVEAGMLSKQPSRPGAMIVNEPATRPDSAIYRAHHPDLSSNTVNMHLHRPALQRESFDASASADQVRATLAALLETHRESRSQVLIEEDGASLKNDDDTVPIRQPPLTYPHHQGSNASTKTGSLHQNAIEDSRLRAHRPLPTNSSSFYQTAIQEAKGEAVSSNMVSTIHEDCLAPEYGEDDRKPAAVEATKISVHITDKTKGDDHGVGLTREGAASSFYQSALEATSADGVYVSATSKLDEMRTTAANQTPTKYSSFYQAAMDAASPDANSGFIDDRTHQPPHH